jgi:endonuclease/exonuclease/phosphatase family metal-dependent hydrolase
MGMIEKKLKNVFKDELRSTFNMRHKQNPGYASAVVDMIFVSPDLKISKHYASDADVSDHIPLIIEIEV